MYFTTPQFEAACQILRTLRDAGYEAYLAGGCVRDLLLGREPKDFDVATSATPDVVLRMFPRTYSVGAHFGVVLVASEPVPGDLSAASAGAETEGRIVTEVATFRSDGVYSDGRRPDVVRYTRSAEEDVQRRDFTINGLLLDPFADSFPAGSAGSVGVDLRDQTDLTRAEINSADRGLADPGRRSPILAPKERREDGARRGCGPVSPGLQAAVIDHVGGLRDLEEGVIRAIGRAEFRFEEDHLRMLRGVRFAARLGFALEDEMAAAIRRLANKTSLVSRERVRDELTKMLTEGNARRAFELLEETGLLQEVLPEVARMKGVEQPAQFHPEGDVWVHTLGLLDQLDTGAPLTLAWGALLHDVGKPATFRRAERIRFDGHVEVGVAISAEICRRFRFSNDETRQILALVENHMRFGDAPKMKAATLKRFFRLENFEQHLALHRMDCLAGSGNLDHWNFVRESFAATPEEAVRPKLLITGRELIAEGYRPGAAFREMLHAVENAQLEGQIHTPEEALRLVRGLYPIM